MIAAASSITWIIMMSRERAVRTTTKCPTTTPRTPMRRSIQQLTSFTPSQNVSTILIFNQSDFFISAFATNCDYETDILADL